MKRKQSEKQKGSKYEKMSREQGAKGENVKGADSKNPPNRALILSTHIKDCRISE